MKRLLKFSAALAAVAAVAYFLPGGEVIGIVSAQAVPVPEPASLALFATGIVAALYAVRRKRK